MEIAFGEAERTIEFEKHVESCLECREEFAVYAFAAKGIEGAPPAPAPSFSNERLYSAIRAQNIHRSSPWMPRFAFAAAATSIALASWLGFNRPTANVQPRYIANADKPVDSAPTGPIEIPEVVPNIKPPVANESVVSAPTRRPHPSVRSSHRRRNAPTSAPTAEVSDELLAVVIGGAEGALETDAVTGAPGAPSMLRTAPTAKVPAAEGPIVVIQPQGQATEKSSDDVSIGG